MTVKKKKMAVLEVLRLHQEAITLKEIHEKLGMDFSERTIRRWLGEMEKEGLIEKLGLRRATKYKVKLQQPATQVFSQNSKKILKQVHRSIYERMPRAYDHRWFDSYVPNKSYYFSEDIRTQLKNLGFRSREDAPAGTYAHQIYERILIDLSYNSSRLEGNTYSLLETKKLLLEGADALGKLDEEKTMILNHKEAIRYLIDSASKLKITEDVVFTVHYLLSDGLVEPSYSGKLRDHGVRIGGSVYIPIENRKRIESQFVEVIKKASRIVDPFEQSLFLLAHISYLQGFVDVNKRTARLCANIPLIKNNLVPLSFNDVEKDDYTSALIAIYEYQEIAPLLDLYQYSYKRTCALYDTTLDAVSFDEVRVRYRKQRREMIREIITMKIVGDEVNKFITLKAREQVKKRDLASFYEDTMEDLRVIDHVRIAGLGVTPEQLEAWKKENQ